jgi:hypothetical protein
VAEKHENGDERDRDEETLDEANLDPREYDTLMELERLESLEEEMQEVGVTTLEELREKIAELHRKLDDEEG